MLTRFMFKLALKTSIFIKMALIAFFFTSFLPASSQIAQAQTQCHGKNLADELAQTDPAKMAQIREEADQIIYGKGIFWKVEKEGAQPSWLLGTMHMTDEAVTNLEPAAEEALKQSDIVVIESTETLDPAAAQAAMLKLRHLTFLQPGKTLSDALSEDEIATLDARLQKRGIPMQVANLMQPWLVGTMIGVPVCELAAKQSGKQILDHQIAQHAIDNGKKLLGLETTAEQFNAIAGLPSEYHITSLRETLSMSADHVEDMIATMKALYKKGEIGLLFPLVKTLAPKAFAGNGAAAFQKALIEERNKTMVSRALETLESGNAFIAVGALHLPGEFGLVHLLQKAGYKVSQVKS